MTLPDALGDQLHAALHDDAWALPVPPDALERVRRGRAHRRRRTVALSTAAALAVSGGAFAAVSLLPSHRASLSQYAEGFSAGQPVPGISPDWTPTSGHDWLLTQAQDQSFEGSHQVPFDGLFGESRVAPSPAPVTSITAELKAYADGAGLPAGSTFASDEAYDHDARVSVLHVTLPGGTPVWVQRTRLAKPEAISYGEDVNHVAGSAVSDIAGTTAALVSYEDYHFGFGTFYNAQGPAHAVKVVTAGGIEWTWIGPYPVPLSQLTRWATAAAQH